MALPMRRFTLLTIVVLFAVLFAATIYQVVLVRGRERTFPGPGITPEPGQLIVTNLVGRSREEAARSLQEAGLGYRVEPLGGSEDTVVAQRPAPGTLVDRGSVIALDVRCEPAPCPAPPKGEALIDPCVCATA